MSVLGRAFAWALPSQRPTRDELGLLALLGAAFLISRYDFSILTLALPDIQRDLHVGENTLGRFLAYARLGAIGALPLALLADRFGRRRLLLATIIGFTVCSVASAFAQDWRTFAVLQFLARSFTAADEMLAAVVVIEEFAVRRRGWAVGVLAASGGLGDGVAAALYPLAGVLPGGWRGLYLIAAVPLLMITVLRRRLPETRRFVAASATYSDRSTSLSVLLAQPARLAALITVTVCYHIPLSAALSFMSKHLQTEFAYSRGEVAALFIGAGAVALIGNLIGGAAGDRLGRRNVFMAVSLSMTIGFAAFYLGSAAVAPFAWTFALLAFLASHAVFLALTAEAYPTVARTTVATLMLVIGAVATSLGLLAENYLFNRLGSHASAITALLPFFAIGGVAARLLLVETSGTALEDQPPVDEDRKNNVVG